MLMKKNLGTADRVIRIVLVVVLSGSAWYWSSWVLGIVAVILAVEAITGWCWLYRFLGVDSTKPRKGEPIRQQHQPPSYADVAARAVADVSADEATVLDVRTKEEWDAGHAAGAVHWPLDRLEQGDMPDIAKDRRIYTHCGFGGRATRAMNILKDRAFSDVLCMGGLSDWQKAGGETESTP